MPYTTIYQGIDVKTNKLKAGFALEKKVNGLYLSNACFSQFIHLLEPTNIELAILNDYSKYYGGYEDVAYKSNSNSTDYFFTFNEIKEFIELLNYFGFPMSITFEDDTEIRVLLKEEEYLNRSLMRYALDLIRCTFERGCHYHIRVYNALMKHDEINSKIKTKNQKFIFLSQFFRYVLIEKRSNLYLGGHQIPTKDKKFFSLDNLFEYCQKNKGHRSGSYSLIGNISAADTSDKQYKIFTNEEFIKTYFEILKKEFPNYESSDSKLNLRIK